MSNERLRTDRFYNLDLIRAANCGGRWQMPIISPSYTKSSRMVGFNYAKTFPDKTCGIHFFIDDYQFERCWRRPMEYVPVLQEYEFCLTPDFSLYMDMPLPLQLFNVYRSRAMGNLWQRNGIEVVPTLQWADSESYGFAFDGLPRKSTVAVSTVGVNRSRKATERWRRGMAEAVRRLEPKTVLLYGKEIDFDSDAEVVNIEAFKPRRRR